jgi:ABC-type transporter MlaC component
MLNYSLPKELPSLTNTQHQGFQTNFSITLKNQYAFILLHLKKTAQTKNTLKLAIPEVSIFYNNLPYEILYNENG